MSTAENPVSARLEAERKGLLDLSLRNPLLNYVPRARSLEFVGESPAQLFRILVKERKRMSFRSVKASGGQTPASEPTPASDSSLASPPDSGSAPVTGSEPATPPDPESLSIPVAESASASSSESPPTSASASTPADVLAPAGDAVETRKTSSQGDLSLDVALPAEQLQSRLLATYYAARTSFEERGANTLFLALGMLVWSEADAPTRRLRAPLLLVPVTLERSNARDRIRLRYNDEEVEANLSLIAKARADFGITFPECPETEELDVDAFFTALDAAIEDRPDWSVDRGAAVLGFFAFGKFLMYRDLEDDAWPEETRPSRHPILRALLQDGFREPSPAVDEDDDLDPLMPPAESYLVVDADSTQTLAILDVAQGRNLVVQGPPGTGKSQTIANLIAEAIGRNQSVLFVAEKMAALEVVKQRLDRVGLGDACLELHSQKTHKRAFLDELRRTLELGRPKLGRIEDDFRILGETRERLNAYCRAIKAPIGESDVSPYHAFGELLKLQEHRLEDVPSLTLPDPSGWSRYDLKRREALVEELQSRLDVVGVPRQHPFWGTRRTVLLPTEIDRLRDQVAAALRSTSTLRAAAEGLARFLGLEAPASRGAADALAKAARRVVKVAQQHGVEVSRNEWLSRRGEVQELLDAGAALAEAHEKLDKVVVAEAWDADLSETRRDLNAHGRQWWRFASPSYLRARRRLASLCQSELPSKLEDRLGLIDAIGAAKAQREVVRLRQNLGADLFASRWHGERSNWSSLSSLAKGITQIHLDIRASRLPAGILEFLANDPKVDKALPLADAVKSALDDHQAAVRRVVEFLNFDAPARFGSEGTLEDRPFVEQEALFRLWTERINDLPPLISYNHLVERCRGDALDGVVAAAEGWPGAARHLVTLFRRHRLEVLLARSFREREALAGFDGRGHEHVIRSFRELDRLSLRHNQARLAFEHWQRLPRHAGGGQLAILRREFEKKTRHLPVRQVLNRAGNAVKAIKPVFLMSPMSVAAYLAPGQLSFDLVIFDEASQVKPVDALGAIARGKQVVVVGDSRQLPPTDFFDRLNAAEEDEDEIFADVESILGLFTSQGAPQRLLRWHYRSRHESLIAVSNREFYDDRLVVFPSPDAGRKGAGLVVRHLPATAYDRGKTRTNVEEAEAVATAAFEHARVQLSRPPDQRLSLGVAAFSIAQAEAIRDRVERLRRDDPSCEDFFAPGAPDPFFVKNLENVQGDERDVIYISIGYGRTAEGDLAMSFGPLNGEGGERRLNVLITRARVRCEVFTNLTSGEIDLGKTQSRGVRALKAFLAYAEQATSSPSPDAGDFDGAEAPFEQFVRNTLVTSGYAVRSRLGSAGSSVDLAVIDPARPDRYLLGIECDGANYQEARSARDRDRLRPQVLESLGWSLCRIWSTDWVRNPDGERKRTISVIEDAIRTAASAVIPPPAPRALPGPTPEAPRVDVSRPTDTPSFSRDGSVGDENGVPSVPVYRLADLGDDLEGVDVETVSTKRLASWATEVVAVESPVHIQEVVRRVADALGLKRVTQKLQSTLESACHDSARRGSIRLEGEFCWQPEMRTPAVRDRGELPSASRKIELVAPEEIEQAVEKVVGDSFGIDPEAVPAAASRLLGFSRTTDEIRERFELAITSMLELGRLGRQGDQLVLNTPAGAETPDEPSSAEQTESVDPRGGKVPNGFTPQPGHGEPSC